MHFACVFVVELVALALASVTDQVVVPCLFAVVLAVNVRAKVIGAGDPWLNLE